VVVGGGGVAGVASKGGNVSGMVVGQTSTGVLRQGSRTGLPDGATASSPLIGRTGMSESGNERCNRVAIHMSQSTTPLPLPSRMKLRSLQEGS